MNLIVWFICKLIYVLVGAKMLLRRCFFAEQRFSLLPTCSLLRIIKENIILTNTPQEKLSLLSQDFKNPDLLTFIIHQNQKKQAEREQGLRYCFWCFMDIYRRRLLQWKPLHCSSANWHREKVGKMTMINTNCF